MSLRLLAVCLVVLRRGKRVIMTCYLRPLTESGLEAYRIARGRW